MKLKSTVLSISNVFSNLTLQKKKKNVLKNFCSLLFLIVKYVINELIIEFYPNLKIEIPF